MGKHIRLFMDIIWIADVPLLLQYAAIVFWQYFLVYSMCMWLCIWFNEKKGGRREEQQQQKIVSTRCIFNHPVTWLQPKTHSLPTLEIKYEWCLFSLFYLPNVDPHHRVRCVHFVSWLFLFCCIWKKCLSQWLVAFLVSTHALQSLIAINFNKRESLKKNDSNPYVYHMSRRIMHKHEKHSSLASCARSIFITLPLWLFPIWFFFSVSLSLVCGLYEILGVFGGLSKLATKAFRNRFFLSSMHWRLAFV